MNIRDVDTPALVIDLDKVEKNLKAMAEYCRSHHINLRPHTKTHKMPSLAKRQLEHGATGLTVAKLGEAEIMVESGVDRLLVAYPIIGRPKAERLAALCEKADVTIALDSPEAVDFAARGTSERGVRAGILVEVDVGFRRCGVQDDQAALKLAQRIIDCSSLEFRGLLFYPGSYVTQETQEEQLRKVNASLERLLDSFQANGIPVPVVSGGSTPTARFSHRFSGLTEIRPGTYIFNDRNTMLHGVAQLDDCAGTVIVTVVSKAVPGKVIVDGGSKTFSSDPCLAGHTGFGLVKEDPEAVFVAMNEEHGYLDVSRSGRRYAIGEKLGVIPNHICATVNLHNEVFFARGETVESVCPVAARGKIR
ncbi:MAG: D-TA family PLP-dependent enzyme [Acidobacteria bacterium]|nr:MAG: D-TA family PLP-dependent enzyme [Acidobacteriota bacterium]